jgi:hypothetical protein
MDVCHFLLGRPWKYDRNVIQDGRKNTYTLEKNGCKHLLFPIEDKGVKEEASSSILFMSGKISSANSYRNPTSPNTH